MSNVWGVLVAVSSVPAFWIFCDSDKENFVSILVTVSIYFRLVSQLVSNEGVCRGFF